MNNIISATGNYLFLLLSLHCNGLLPMYPVQAFQASHSPSHLSALYEGESVVLTGATGFVGLRTLKTLLMHTEVDNIILPIRVKGDVEDEEAAIQRFSNVLSKYGEGLDLSIESPRLCFVPCHLASTWMGSHVHRRVS